MLSRSSSSSVLILDGKQIASELNDSTKKSISSLLETKKLKKINLSIIQVENNEDSERFINSKLKLAESLGINGTKYNFTKNDYKKVLEKIHDLNEDNEVTAILLQLPLPETFDVNNLINSIDPSKDCDGLHPKNIELLNQSSNNSFSPVPVTPRGIIHLVKIALKEIKGSDSISGLKTLVIGRSQLVGRPTASLLLKENATVTVCHSKTKDLSSYTKDADIIISATGQPGLIRADMIKNDSIIIDVGLTYINGKATGDVLFEECKQVCSAITPVPGGVGPLTTAMLMDNIYQIAFNKFS